MPPFLNRDGDILFEGDLAILNSKGIKHGVVTGLDLLSVSTLTINISSGIMAWYGNPVYFADRLKEVTLSSGQSQDRIDYLVYNFASGVPSGTVYPVYGIPANPPTPRSLANMEIPLFEVDVPANAISLSTSNVTDKRPIVWHDFPDYLSNFAESKGEGVVKGFSVASGTFGVGIVVGSGTIPGTVSPTAWIGPASGTFTSDSTNSKMFSVYAIDRNQLSILEGRAAAVPLPPIPFFSKPSFPIVEGIILPNGVGYQNTSFIKTTRIVPSGTILQRKWDLPFIGSSLRFVSTIEKVYTESVTIFRNDNTRITIGGEIGGQRTTVTSLVGPNENIRSGWNIQMMEVPYVFYADIRQTALTDVGFQRQLIGFRASESQANTGNSQGIVLRTGAADVPTLVGHDTTSDFGSTLTLTIGTTYYCRFERLTNGNLLFDVYSTSNLRNNGIGGDGDLRTASKTGGLTTLWSHCYSVNYISGTFANSSFYTENLLVTQK